MDLHIRAWREWGGLTQTELAGRLGVTQEAVSRWETEQRNVTALTQRKIAAALGITPDKLWIPPNLSAMHRAAPDGYLPTDRAPI